MRKNSEAAKVQGTATETSESPINWEKFNYYPFRNFYEYYGRNTPGIYRRLVIELLMDMLYVYAKEKDRDPEDVYERAQDIFHLYEMFDNLAGSPPAAEA